MCIKNELKTNKIDFDLQNSDVRSKVNISGSKYIYSTKTKMLPFVFYYNKNESNSERQQSNT